MGRQLRAARQGGHSSWSVGTYKHANDLDPFCEALEAVGNTIPHHFQTLPQLAKLVQVGARPGWALRGIDSQGYVFKPTRQALEDDPGTFIGKLLDRVARYHLHPKWTSSSTSGDMTAFTKRYGLVAGDEDLETSDMCLPLKRLPRESKHLHHRHYLDTYDKGYTRIYLGKDAAGNPVYEYLHRLINMAFNGPPGPGEETSHLCGNHWCCTRHHLAWENHEDNMNN